MEGQPSMDGPIPEMVMLSSRNKAGWISHDKQAIKQHSNVATVSAPASSLPVQTSFEDELWFGSIK